MIEIPQSFQNMSTKKRQGEGTAIIPTERIENKIFLIRGKKVMFDSDLAELYGVPTKRLNEQVKRNRRRFPDDFMFRLTKQEAESLRSQIATSNEGQMEGRGGRRYQPLCFTEQGIAMLSSVLNSEQAIQVNIHIIRVFTRLRELLATHAKLRRSLLKTPKLVKTKVPSSVG